MKSIRHQMQPNKTLDTPARHSMKICLEYAESFIIFSRISADIRQKTFPLPDYNLDYFIDETYQQSD